jgi:sRNA-binding protein
MAIALEDEMLPILVKAFPKAFFPQGRNCLPLRLGIFEALDAALPPGIDRSRLKLYLGIYTKQPRYLRELIQGAVRIDLNGSPTGRVSAKQATSAAGRLRKAQGKKFGPPMAKPAVPAQASAPAITPDQRSVELPRRGVPQKLIVVLKKRKVSSSNAHQIGMPSRRSHSPTINTFLFRSDSKCTHPR